MQTEHPHPTTALARMVEPALRVMRDPSNAQRITQTIETTTTHALTLANRLHNAFLGFTRSSLTPDVYLPKWTGVRNHPSRWASGPGLDPIKMISLRFTICCGLPNAHLAKSSFHLVANPDVLC